MQDDFDALLNGATDFALRLQEIAILWRVAQMRRR